MSFLRLDVSVPFGSSLKQAQTGYPQEKTDLLGQVGGGGEVMIACVLCLNWRFHSF